MERSLATLCDVDKVLGEPQAGVSSLLPVSTGYSSTIKEFPLAYAALGQGHFGKSLPASRVLTSLAVNSKQIKGASAMHPVNKFPSSLALSLWPRLEQLSLKSFKVLRARAE